MRKPAALATVKDVARLAQVSPATVSRAFNMPELLDQATLEKVRAASQKLRYQPLGIARSLRRKRSMVVGTVMQSMESATFIAGMIEHSQTLLAAHGYTMLLASSQFSDEKALEACHAMIRQGIDALVLISASPDPSVFTLLDEFAIPYVSAWNIVPGRPSQGFDHLRGTLQVTRHLLDLGHRRFAVVMPSVKTYDSRGERLRAIQNALATHGLSSKHCHVVEGLGPGILDGRRALARIAEDAPATTAVICGNDNLAAGAILEAQTRGLLVPRDMSIAGYNDLDIAAGFEPAITTVKTPYEPIARAVVEHLLARLKGEEPVRSQPIPAELVVRASTGAPRKRG